MTLHRSFLVLALLSTTLWAGSAAAETATKTDAPCPSASDRACMSAAILKDAAAIDEAQWRDQIYRDHAASLTSDQRIDDAIALIGKITNPDTQAMTVRSISMTAALYGKDSPEALKGHFAKLAATAKTIQQPAAQAIAFTYIAMAQAFAGLDDDAWATAAAMENPALRHKAYAETAEIQAEQGNVVGAAKSIAFIDAVSFRNKASRNVAEILIKGGKFDDALRVASAIDNPMQRAQTMQHILHAQEKAARSQRNDLTEPSADD